MTEPISIDARPCPGCFAADGRRLGQKSGFDVLICSCGTIYTASIPMADESQDYDGYYDELNLNVPDFIHSRVAEIIERFEPYRMSNRLLDIGFGSGTILAGALKKNWEAVGTEVSLPAVEHARKNGWKAFHGTLRDAAFPDGHFDVVTASEILEHLDDPRAELKEIGRILRPGGLFWATTPHARSLSFRILGLDWSMISPPEHLQLYSRRAIHRMVESSGLEVLALRTTALNPGEIFRYFRPLPNTAGSFHRVTAAYELNEILSRSASRAALKSILNGLLNITRTGDSIKLLATKTTDK